MPNLLQTLLGAPVWVWPLLAALIWLGVRSSKRRTTPAGPMIALPLLGLISLHSLSKLPHPLWVWGAFCIAYGVGAAWGYQRQAAWLLAKQGRQVTLAGEWATLTTFMLIFWSNFTGGVAKAIAPNVANSVWWVTLLAALVGLASGSLAGRALRVLKA